MNKKIFISYCWKNETIVDEIDKSFEKDGIKLTRDKRDTEYKVSIKEFMKKIRSTDSVFMVVSDAYLKSKNGLETWREENRTYLMKQDISQLNELSEKIRIERKKV
jgi:hypothetical protein